jgi:hypothetical protein
MINAAGSEAGAPLLLAEGGGGSPTEGVKTKTEVGPLISTALNIHSYSTLLLASEAATVWISMAVIRVRPPGYFTHVSITMPIPSALKNYYRYIAPGSRRRF